MAVQRIIPMDIDTVVADIFDQTSGSLTISSGSARFSSTNGKGTSLGTSAWFRTNFPLNPGPTFLPMFSASFPNLSGNANQAIMTVEDSGTTQISLAFDALGRLQFYRGNPTTNAIGPNSGAYVLQPGVYHRYEVKFKIDNGAGTVELRIDGNATPVIIASGLITRATANNFFNSIRLGDVSGANWNGSLWSDVIFLDDTGGSLNTFLGDRKLLTAMPASAGDFTQFTPHGAATNWQSTNEIPPNGDTSYVDDGTIGDRDDYGVQALAFSGNADFAVVYSRIRKDDVNPHTIQQNVRSSGVDAFSADISVPSSYIYAFTVFENDPNTGVHFTQAGQNAMQIGRKITL